MQQNRFFLNFSAAKEQTNLGRILSGGKGDLTMTNLKCHVDNCIHHSPERCCKPEIHVDGPCACGCEQTCCGSFEMQNGTGSAAVNACGRKVPNESLQVHCSASNCLYNQKGECSASSIDISPCGCSTPDCKSQTECASFRIK